MSRGMIQSWAGLRSSPGAGPGSGVLGDGQEGVVDDDAELVHHGDVVARRTRMVQAVGSRTLFVLDPGTELGWITIFPRLECKEYFLCIIK